jgi:hypothetical protein
MSTPFQLVIVGLLVAVATAYVLRATWKTWFGKSQAGCGSGCGKCSTPKEPVREGRFPLPQL